MSEQYSVIGRFPEVRTVEASAGSGKTYALARRYVELLFLNRDTDVFALKNILAITFSNKASIEMKERILLFLKKLALGCFEDRQTEEAFLRSRGDAGGSLSDVAFRAMDQIIKNYNFFQVQTIDSFINAILSGCAFRMGLSAKFKIKTEFRDYLAYGLDALIERVSGDRRLTGLFLDFLHQYLALENKGGWFPKKDILETVVDLYARLNRYGGEFEAAPGTLADLIAKKQEILASLRRLRKNLPQGTHALFARKLEEFVDKHETGFAIAELSDFFCREDFPAKKDAPPDAATQKLWQKLRRDIRRVAEAESLLVFNAYVAIFQEVFRDFRALANKEDVLFLEELNRQAHVLFDEKKMDIPELYYRLSLRLKHYLIDEFQDTSPLQWRNLDGLVREALSVAGSLFYVGDKKQAIYRFRGGDVSLFDSVTHALKSFEPVRCALRRNYRSRREIVGFANRIFCRDNLSRFLGDLRASRSKSALGLSGDESVLHIFSGAEQELSASRDGGYVRLSLLDASDADEKNELVRRRFYDLLDELKGRACWGDIAVLVRENEDVELVSGWLIEKGLPVESEKTLDIRNNALIKELVSFLRFLHSPIDNLAFVSFVLGEIFARSSRLKNDALHDFIFALRKDRDQTEDGYFYRAFRSRFGEVWDALIDEFFRNVGYVPLYELVISILRRFECLEAFADQQAFFMRFLEMIKEEEEDHGSLASFLEFFDSGEGEPFYVRPPKTDAVKVLTIHKAKGLGFRICILPFLEMRVKVPSVLTSVAADRLTLLRLTEKSRAFSPVLEEAYAREFTRCFIDELDNMYVALTRARDELHIFVPKVPRRTNLAVTLLGVEAFEAGEPPADPQKAAAAERPEVLSCAVYQDWIQFLKDEFSDRGLIERRHALLKGEVLHSILSCIGDLSTQDAGKVLADACEKARLAYPYFAGLAECRRIVEQMIASSALRAVFYAPQGEVFVEKELIDTKGYSRRIDRLVVLDKECLIFDYKTTADERERGATQVREYMQLMTEIYPDRRVRGFLVFCDLLSAEEVY